MTDRIKHGLIRLRPRADTIYVSQNRTVLSMTRDGSIDEGVEHGMFVSETRLLSRYEYRINGRKPVPVALSNVEQHSWLGYYIFLPKELYGEADEGSGMLDEMTQHTLELRISRYVADGIHEDVDLTNYTQRPLSFELQLNVDADFADIAETKRERQQKGEILKEWNEAEKGAELYYDYHAEHQYDVQGNTGVARIHRGITLQIANADSHPIYENNIITFQINLKPLQKWHACINQIPFIDGERLANIYGCRSFGKTTNEYDHRRTAFFKEVTAFSTAESETLASVVSGALVQAKRDLGALRLYDLDIHEHAWVMAAGLPIYIALFGRDTLTAALQSALASTSMMRGVLPRLAEFQGEELNDWRDEQPGRMLHEAHDGPLATLKYNPRRRYYGSITTSGFYPVLLSELWHWTGDKDLVIPFVEPALKALRWLDQYSDMDGDGFYEYKTHSIQGVENQAWKDSADAIVYEDGSLVKPPIATCEEQGFAYLAKLHMSEVLWWLDDKENAKRLYKEAGELKKRFNDAFWMEKEGFFAMSLDPEKRQVGSIGSNAGHCLATGIVNESLVSRTAERFMADDLFTGWGIRTLSNKHPAYNPYSYHRGSVWPVEHGSFAIGFARYGLHHFLHDICLAQFNAASLFDFYRLPELFSGHQLDEDHPFPALYPQANSPQAWSSSTIFSFVQSMLGLYPYAPLKILLVDPFLPDWLPEITLRDLKVGDASITIRFFRKGEKSDYEVLDKRGTLHVIRQPSPWSLTTSFAERLKDILTSLL
jgi:glycogen debranching enzyme